MVSKDSVEKKELGGIKNTYVLSEEGRTFFKPLLGTRSDESEGTPFEKETREGDPHSLDFDLLEDLLLEIPEFLTDAGVFFNREQLQQFQRKIGAFLERKGLHVRR